MTQFAVTITRHVTGCGKNLQGTVEVTVLPSKVIDEQQRYVLYSNGWWATSDITSTLNPDGTSTGLNAQSQDATATIISNVIGTIAQIAIGIGAGAEPGAIAGDVCKKDILDAVDSMGAAKKQVDQDTADLTAATAKVALLTSQSQFDAGYKKDIAKALQTQSEKASKLDADQATLAKYLGLTTDTQIVSWPAKASEFRRDQALVLDSAVLQKWSASADSTAAGIQFSVYLALYRQNSGDGSWTTPPSPAGSNVSVGVPVRLAHSGLLLICTQQKCPETLPAGWSCTQQSCHLPAGWLRPGTPEPLPTITAASQVVLQIGDLYTVPVTGGTFKSESAVIALDVSGLPTSIEVIEKVAAGAALSGAAKDAATQVVALPGQISAAQAARIQAQTTLLTNQAALANARANAAVLGQTSALAAQTSIVNAQLALANAAASLAKASQP